MTWSAWEFVARQLWGRMADASLRAIVLAALAGLLILFLRKRSAAQHAVWALVTIGMLALPLLRPIIPAAHMPIAQPKVFEAVRPMPEPQLAINLNPQRTLDTSAETSPEQHDTTAFRPSWMFYVAAVYIGGVLLCALRLLLAFLLIRRTLGRTRSIRPDFVRLGTIAQVAAKTQIEESEHVKVPVTLGLIRMRVILPVEWHTWPEEKISVVLAHELEHVRRRDPLFALLAAVNQCVFWFHPLAWWLQRRLAVLAEHAADDAGIRVVNDAASYARVVLEIASSMRGEDRRLIWNSSAIGGAAMTGGALARRIRRVIRLQGVAYAKRLGKTARVFLFTSALLLLWVAVAVEFQNVTHAFSVAAVQNEDEDDEMRYLESVKSHIEKWVATEREAAQAERQLAANPEDETTRYNLLVYYYWLDPTQYDRLDGPKDRRIPLILWLVDHHPESKLHAFQEVQIFEGPVAGGNSVFENVVKHWQAQVARHPQDADVLWNAGEAMLSKQHDQEAIQLLRHAQKLDPAQKTNAIEELVLGRRPLSYKAFVTDHVVRDDVTAEQAAQLERRLAADPEDEITRYQLVHYYSSPKVQPSGLNRPGDRRIPLILWLIDHHPESKLHAEYEFEIRKYSPESDSVLENVVKHWQAQVALHPQDARVLSNAAGAMSSKQYAQEVADLMKRAQILDPAQYTSDLVSFYSIELVANTEISTKKLMKNPDLAVQIRHELSASRDLALVGMTAIEVVEDAVSLRNNPDHDWDLASLHTIASELLSHAQKLDPQNQHLDELLERSGRDYEPNRTWSGMMSSWVSISALNAAGNIIRAPSAIHLGIPAPENVELQIRIDKNGHVADVKAVPERYMLQGYLWQAYPRLVRAAIKAAQQCIYKPVSVDGNPVEVITNVTVDIPSPRKS